MTRELLLKLTTRLFWLALTLTLVMALLPRPPVPFDLEAGDKVWHMLAFAVITLLATAAFPDRKPLLLFIAMVLLGGLIEVLQLIPALLRDAELLDWIADCVAVAATLIIWRLGRGSVGHGRKQPAQAFEE